MDTRPQFILPPVLDPLKDYQKWNVWRWEQDEKGEWKKPPFMPRPPYHKSPLTWGSFEEAMQALLLGSFSGLGFDFRGTKILSFDLDDCRNPETGVVLPEALRTVHKIQTYTEISPSGKGLKLFGTGSGAKIYRKLKVPNSPMSMEFWRDCDRYSTVTGNVLPGTEQYPLADISAWMDWFVSYLDRANELFKTLPEDIREALDFNTKGERSEKFFGVVLWLHDHGCSVDDIGMLLAGTPVASKYEKEGKNRLRKQIEDCISKSNPQGGGGQKGTRKLVGRSLEGLKPRAVAWVWRGWIAKGYLTLLAGESGAGKSTVLADIAARISTGRPWPGETQARKPERIAWLGGSEDGMQEMTLPRLMAAGYNDKNIIEIEGAEDQHGNRSSFSMQDDIGNVEWWLQYAINEGNPFGMLIIDPVTSYLPGERLRKVDMNDAGQIRSILEPWFTLAQKYKIAIICVTHFAKDTTRSMLHRVLGSGAFNQTCRSLIAVTDLSATENFITYEKAMIQVKTNLPEHPGGSWRFKTEKVQVSYDDEQQEHVSATRVVWDELDTTLSATNVFGSQRGPKTQYGTTFGIWLKSFFTVRKSEWLPVEEVKSAAIRENAASDSFWSKHGKDFMEKKNENGIWICRPAVGQNRGT